MSYCTSIEVRFADLDAYGHVNNAVYFTYLETARTKLFIDPFHNLLRQGILLLVARSECDFRHPIGLQDKVLVEITPENFGRSSFELAYRLHNGEGITFASARTVMVCYDQAKKRPTALPGEIQDLLHK